MLTAGWALDGCGAQDRRLWPTHRQLLLQADAERLGVVGLQLLEGHPRLPYELVVAEFVLITHRDPGGQGASQFAAKVSADLQAVGRGMWGGPALWTRLGGVGEPAARGLTHRRVFRIMSSSVIP